MSEKTLKDLEELFKMEQELDIPMKYRFHNTLSDEQISELSCTKDSYPAEEKSFIKRKCITNQHNKMQNGKLRELYHFQHWLASNYNTLPTDSVEINERTTKYLEQVKTARYKCLLCGRDKFTRRTPHYCVGGFRKRKLQWEEIMQ